MICPNCKSETRVIDSRRSVDETTRRRRECPICAVRFTTYEARVDSESEKALRRLDRSRSRLERALTLLGRIRDDLPQGKEADGARAQSEEG